MQRQHFQKISPIKLALYCLFNQFAVFLCVLIFDFYDHDMILDQV